MVFHICLAGTISFFWILRGQISFIELAPDGQLKGECRLATALTFRLYVMSYF